jgi:hypothetical protein
MLKPDMADAVSQPCDEVIVFLSILYVNVIQRHHFNTTIIQRCIQKSVVHPLDWYLLDLFSRCTVFLINSLWQVVINLWHDGSSHTIPSL